MAQVIPIQAGEADINEQYIIPTPKSPPTNAPS